MYTLERMRTALSVREFAKTTIDTYCSCVGRFGQHFGQPPDELGAEHAGAYFEHLTEERKLKARTRNVYHAALRFLYGVVLDRPEVMAKVPRARTPHTVPVVLSGSEVAQLLRLVRSFKHRTILSSCYAAGLRIGAACAIRIEDIDSQRMLLRVPKAKSRARYVMLSERLLAMLREHWRRTRPAGAYLFPGGHGRDFVSPKSVSKALHKAVLASGIGKRVSTHTLRHSFATHLIDLGTDIRTVQTLLGHASVNSTSHYTKLSRAHLNHRSPFDLLGTPAAEPLG